MSADQVELELRERARLTVRAQLLDPGEQLLDLEAAVRQAMPHTDATILARAWLAAERKRHAVEAAEWSRPTDHDRLTAALEECVAHDVVLLLGVDDPGSLGDLVAARIAERTAPQPMRGVVWATEADVFHAVDHGILELRLLDADRSSAGETAHLTTAVMTCVERHGLRVRYHDNRIQVALRWRAVPRP